MPSERLTPATYTMPPELKERIETEAREQDLTASQLARRILADFFQRQDIEHEIAARQPQKAA